MCVNNLPRVALDSGAAGIRNHDLSIASPALYSFRTEPHTCMVQGHIVSYLLSYLLIVSGRGSAAGRKFLAPPYYSQCAVFVSPI